MPPKLYYLFPILKAGSFVARLADALVGFIAGKGNTTSLPMFACLFWRERGRPHMRDHPIASSIMLEHFGERRPSILTPSLCELPFDLSSLSSPAPRSCLPRPPHPARRPKQPPGSALKPCTA